MPTARRKNGAKRGASTAEASMASAVRQDFETLREGLTALANDITGLAQETSEDTLTEIKERAQRLRENLDDVVATASERGRDAVDDLNETLQDSLRERPLTVLAIAAGIGFIIGATWRR